MERWLMKEGAFVPYKVETPYGIGWLKSVGESRKDGIKKIELMEGKMTLFTMEEYPKSAAVEGDEVVTMFGRGRVVREVTVRCRKKDNPGKEKVYTKYHVQLSNWVLAQGSRIMLYIFQEDVYVVKKKSLGEMSALERVDFAKRQKERAQKAFLEKQYQAALNLYSGAVDSLQYVQYNASIDNYLRAELLIIIISCSNNAATCCVKLLKNNQDTTQSMSATISSKNNADQGTRFANNSLRLIAALERKKGLKIHTVLQNHFKISDSKLFGEWQIKSYLVILHAINEINTGYEPEVIGICKKGLAIVSKYLQDDSNNKVLKQQEREISKIYKKCLEEKRQHLQKEKARAQAMFAKSKSSIEDSKSSSSSNNEEKLDQAPQKPITKKTPSKPSMKPSKPVTVRSAKDPKRVSFSLDTNKRDEYNGKSNTTTKAFLGDTSIEEEYDEPWYMEHKEALMLLAAGGLATVSMMMLRKK